jgi:hypothetical protein
LTTQDVNKKKDMRKIIFFACHKFGHYAGKCTHMNMRENETQSEVVVSTKTQVDTFCKKFEQTKFLLVSQTSMGIILTDVWLIDNGATWHTKGAQEVFNILTRSKSKMHVEFGMGTKHVVKAFGTMPF